MTLSSSVLCCFSGLQISSLSSWAITLGNAIIAVVRQFTNLAVDVLEARLRHRPVARIFTVVRRREFRADEILTHLDPLQLDSKSKFSKSFVRAAHIKDPDGNFIEIESQMPTDKWSKDLRREVA
jgi:hypothetical protein